jgi:hypothetical protein
MGSAEKETVIKQNPFSATYSRAEAFYVQAIEEGLIGINGNCLLDSSVYPIPALSEEGLGRLNERLDRKSGNVRKSLAKFPEEKISKIKLAYDQIAIYCSRNGVENPFRIDFEKMVGEIKGLSFSLRAFLGYLIIVKGTRIPSIAVDGGDLVYICGGSFYLDAIKSLNRPKLTEYLDFNFLKQFQGYAPDFDIKIGYPAASWGELEKFINDDVFGYLAKKLFIFIPDKILLQVKYLIRELAFVKLCHAYNSLGGHLDHFYLLSFEDVDGMKVDMKFVSSQVHKQLFHAHGLSLEISKLIEGKSHDLKEIIPHGESCGGWQAIFELKSDEDVKYFLLSRDVESRSQQHL